MRRVFPQSGVIPRRRGAHGMEIMLITSRRGTRWVIPKGLIDPGETAASSAEREAEEEAGVTGRIGAAPIGRYEYEKWGGHCVVDVFTLDVEDEADEWEESFRTRRWFSVEAASGKVREKALRALIRAAGDV